jgi:hypothetical protein
MLTRRIFAGSIVALLLSVSSLAAACDLSCAFASMNSDCHSEQTKFQNSAPGGMKMDGVAMAGMAMPEVADGDGQRTAAAAARPGARHPSIGEMEPCERQSCDNESAVSVKASRSVRSQPSSILALAENPRVDRAPQFFHDARDDVARYRPRDGNPLQITLRI